MNREVYGGWISWTRINDGAPMLSRNIAARSSSVRCKFYHVRVCPCHPLTFANDDLIWAFRIMCPNKHLHRDLLKKNGHLQSVPRRCSRLQRKLKLPATKESPRGDLFTACVSTSTLLQA